jgi:hypothetical protein
MVGFTLVALVAAGAGALGYFDGDGSPERPAPRAAVAPTRTLVPFNSPLAFIPADPLTVTFYIVDSEEARDLLDSWEDETIFREILERDAIEVLLVRTPEEEAAAEQALEEAAVLAEESGFILVVEDLRDTAGE